MLTALALAGIIHATRAQAALPQLAIQTGGLAIPDEPKVDVVMRLTVGGEVDYAGPAGIEIRGRSSQSYPKQGFGLETRQADGSNANVSLLGMPAENDWVLHGPYADKSLVRNALMYATARALGRYAPRTRFVELEVDSNYRGLYLLAEKVKMDRHRVGGDYLLQINFGLDRPDDGWLGSPVEHEGYTLQTTYKYEDPDPDELLPAERKAIRQQIDRLEQVLEGQAFEDPELGYPAYIDVDSWVDYVILNELSGDVDAYFGSTFLTLEDGRLSAGPVWDHNFAFGNADYCAGASTQGLGIEHEALCSGHVTPLIFARVWDDPAFRVRVATRYFELRRGPLGPGLWGRLDSLTRFVAPVQVSNFARWPILGHYVWPNTYVGPTWELEVDYLERWIIGRLTWLDETFAGYLDEEPGTPSADAAVLIAPHPARAGSYFTLTPIERSGFGKRVAISIFPLTGGNPRYLADGILPLRAELPDALQPGMYLLRLIGEVEGQSVFLVK